MLNFYQEVLMDHYRNPRNNGVIDQSDFRAEQRNSSCGDEVLFMGNINENHLCNVLFTGIIRANTMNILNTVAFCQKPSYACVRETHTLIN